MGLVVWTFYLGRNLFGLPDALVLCPNSPTDGAGLHNAPPGGQELPHTRLACPAALVVGVPETEE